MVYEVDERIVLMQERLQKVISQAGIASRRAAEKMIQEGRVKVNGKLVTELGVKVDPKKFLHGSVMFTFCSISPKAIFPQLRMSEAARRY